MSLLPRSAMSPRSTDTLNLSALALVRRAEIAHRGLEMAMAAVHALRTERHERGTPRASEAEAALMTAIRELTSELARLHARLGASC